MSTFKMPAKNTPEYAELQERWESRPISFDQCRRLKYLFKLVNDAGGYAGKVTAKDRKRFDLLTQRDDEMHWINLRSDKMDDSMWDAHLLMEQLQSILEQGMTTTKTAKVSSDVAAVVAHVHRADSIGVDSKTLHYNDGDLIIVNGETCRISVNGRRKYLASV